MGVVRFAIGFPHTFYVVAAPILFLGMTAGIKLPVKSSSKVDQTLSWSGCAGFCASCRMPADHCHWPDTMNYNSIVCFRIDEAIDKRISRILGPKYATRSQFIRTAIERLLLQESEERLRAAQAAIRWG